MTISVMNTASEGFRVARRNPVTLLVWGAFLVFSYAVFFGIMLLVGGAEMFTAMGGPAAVSNPAGMMQAVTRMMSAELVGLPVLLVLLSVLLTAIYRSVLRPEQKGFAYLRIGGDELRVAAVMVILTLISWVAVAALTVVIGGLTGAVSASHGSLGGLVGGIGAVAGFCAFVWAGVRLSLASVDTFIQGAIRPFQSWRLTRGSFWRLLGMYFMVVVFMIVVIIVIYLAMMVLALLGFGGAAAMGPGGAHNPLSSLATAAPLLLVLGLVAILIYAAGMTLMFLLTYAAQAAAYRQLNGADAAQAF